MAEILRSAPTRWEYGASILRRDQTVLSSRKSNLTRKSVTSNPVMTTLQSASTTGGLRSRT